MLQLMSTLVSVITLRNIVNLHFYKLSGKVLLNHSKQSDTVDTYYDLDILMNAYC